MGFRPLASCNRYYHSVKNIAKNYIIAKNNIII